jgi:hypothetical protein
MSRIGSVPQINTFLDSLISSPLSKDNISVFSWVLRKRLWHIAKLLLAKSKNLKVCPLLCVVSLPVFFCLLVCLCQVDHLAMTVSSVPVPLRKEMVGDCTKPLILPSRSISLFTQYLSLLAIPPIEETMALFHFSDAGSRFHTFGPFGAQLLHDHP